MSISGDIQRISDETIPVTYLQRHVLNIFEIWIWITTRVRFVTKRAENHVEDRTKTGDSTPYETVLPLYRAKQKSNLENSREIEAKACAEVSSLFVDEGHKEAYQS
ncbi:hypothetical protein Lser_V15G01520 [Lactuca serriola]